jgi:hypothetical protein
VTVRLVRPTSSGGLGGRGQRTPEQGPSGPDHAGGGPGGEAEPGPQPGGGRADLEAVFGAGGPAGIDPGQFLEPLAVQLVGQTPQDPDPVGPDGVGEPVQVAGGQPVQDGGQLGQLIGVLVRRLGRLRRLGRPRRVR